MARLVSLGKRLGVGLRTVLLWLEHWEASRLHLVSSLWHIRVEIMMEWLLIFVIVSLIHELWGAIVVLWPVSLPVDGE